MSNVRYGLPGSLRLLIFLSGILLSNGQKPSYSPALETALRAELFNSYEVLQRPNMLCLIDIGLTILTVNDLNIKDQVLSVSGYLSYKWSDGRLSWSNSGSTSQDYTSVIFLFSTEEYVWRPSLIIENSINDISVISDKTTPMRITQGGKITWNPTGIFVVSCESDTTYYPFDTQECSIKVTVWGYTVNEVSLTLDPSGSVDMSFYSPNGEWDLLEVWGTKPADKSVSGSAFSSLTFSLKLKRRAMFHILNTMLPVVLMAVLMSMVFKLSLESGEKIGFSLTVLLAYAVYLTMISDNIPSTSVTVCYLSVYLVFILTLGAMSVILTIFSLSVHFKPEEKKMPQWLKSLTQTVLMFLACTRPCKKCNRGSKIEEAPGNLPLKVPLDKNGHDGNDEAELTWKDLANIMDKIFFNTYILLIIISTIVLFNVLMNQS